MLSKIKNNHILISAATSDIGTAIAKRLAVTNDLVMHGRDIEKLQALVGTLETDHKILVWNHDLTQVDSIQKSLKDFIVTHDIAISDFVHCAGTLRILPFKAFRLEYATEIFDVNFFSAVEIIKTLLLKTNDQSLRGIVFISSLFSKLGDKGNSIYAASKGALDSLVNSLALELAPKVRVNSVLPGGLKTHMTKPLFESEEYMQSFREKYILGEGECDDVASMVVFLLSQNAKWITGQHFTVDGGCSCH